MALNFCKLNHIEKNTFLGEFIAIKRMLKNSCNRATETHQISCVLGWKIHCILVSKASLDHPINLSPANRETKTVGNNL